MASTSKSRTTLFTNTPPRHNMVDFKVPSSKLQDLVHVAFKADRLVTSVKALPEKAIRLTGIQRGRKRAPAVGACVAKYQEQVKEQDCLQSYGDCTNKQHEFLKQQ